MGDRSGQLAYGSHTSRMSEGRLCLMQRFFGTLLLCNILAGNQDNPLISSKDSFRLFANPKHRAILTHFAEFPIHRLAESLQADGDRSLNRFAINFIKKTEQDRKSV